MAAVKSSTKTSVKTVKAKKSAPEKQEKPQYIPRATEKAYTLQGLRQYSFLVPMSASKQEIAKNISNNFNVTVVDVRVNIRKGKKTRYSRGKHAYPGITYRRDHKFAYVTLKEGDKIAVFEEQEDEKSKAAKATKAASSDKKADKKAEKAEKKAAKKAEKKGDK